MACRSRSSQYLLRRASNRPRQGRVPRRIKRHVLLHSSRPPAWPEASATSSRAISPFLLACPSRSCGFLPAPVWRPIAHASQEPSPAQQSSDITSSGTDGQAVWGSTILHTVHHPSNGLWEIYVRVLITGPSVEGTQSDPA